MFGFPKSESIIFKRNFLRKVSFKIDFKKNISIIDNEELIRECFENKFPRITKSQGTGIQITIDSNNPKMKSLKGNEFFVLKSPDGFSILEITDTYIMITFDASAYKSSKNIRDILPLFIDFLNKKNIKEIEKIEINKINIIEFDSKENPNGIIYFLLNNNVIGNVDAFPNTNLINYNLQVVNYRNEDYSLNLKYGMNIPPLSNLNVGQVIIDINASKYTRTNISELNEKFEILNTEIFNVFNFLINDNTKNNILNGDTI